MRKSVNQLLSIWIPWLAHVQGSNALVKQCDGKRKEAVAENLFLRQLRFVIVSITVASVFISSLAGH